MDKEIIRKKISSAPEDIKEIINSFDIVDLLEKIAPENQLNQELQNNLGQVIVRTLVGIIKKSDFLNQLVTIGIPQDTAKKIETEVDEKIFSKVHISLEKIQSEIKDELKINVNPVSISEEIINKNDVLAEIENPIPTKSIVSNPAGKNPILDAQHNLPEVEKKVLISSAAVPSRGPILSNFKNNFAVQSNAPVIPPISPEPVIPAPQPAPVAAIIPQPIPAVQSVPATPTTTPITPKPIEQIPVVVLVQPPQPSQTPQTTTPPTPKKYTVDPYREPLE